MEIEIIGAGCSKCRELERRVRKALEEYGKKADIRKVTDMNEIMERTSMTPALAINGKIVSAGRLPEVSEIMKWLAE